MRTKTLNQIAQEAAKYAVETLDIERAMVVKQARDEVNKILYRMCESDKISKIANGIYCTMKFHESLNKK